MCYGRRPDPGGHIPFKYSSCLLNGDPRTLMCSWEPRTLWPLQPSKISLCCCIPQSLATIKYSQWSKDACPLFLQCLPTSFRWRSCNKDGGWRDPHSGRNMAQMGGRIWAWSQVQSSFFWGGGIIACYFLGKSFNYLSFKTLLFYFAFPTYMMGRRPLIVRTSLWIALCQWTGAQCNCHSVYCKTISTSE